MKIYVHIIWVCNQFCKYVKNCPKSPKIVSNPLCFIQFVWRFMDHFEPPEANFGIAGGQNCRWWVSALGTARMVFSNIFPGINFLLIVSHKAPCFKNIVLFLYTTLGSFSYYLSFTWTTTGQETTMHNYTGKHLTSRLGRKEENLMI